GPDLEVGEHLVTSPQTRFISFTGSVEVGKRIHELGARVLPGQRFLKRVVTEMGGKDAIVVDETADLDAAADGVVASAFGYQGQKCSACSRLIVVDDVHDALLERVVARTRALRLGDAADPATDVAALISEAQYDKVRSYLDLARTEGRIVAGGQTGDPGGWFVEPTVVDEVLAHGRLAREEVFGPVLAVLRASSWGTALRIANDSDYGLTGGVYTRRRDRVDEARRSFQVGNLYVNRKITGSLVGVQPFGGFNLSGTDVKSGAPDYLRAFLQLKTVTERF
ncbi:MAG TPA: aldehyde dehydrogenase family protein, partial [Acidimicrobiales bacterium]|nr:aldehyde dehydrogenase family protein [Acidimicrobiales bacterium]